MRASLLLESDPSAAAHQASDILAVSPGHTAASLLLATARRRLGEPAAAASVLESLAGTEANSPVIQLELGRAYAAAGRTTEAAAAFRRAVTFDAGLADAWWELAAQLHAAGEAVEGDRAYARHQALSPDPPELKDAMAALANNRTEAAAMLLRQHLQRKPRDVVALRLLAEACTKLEDDVEAERRLTECLQIAPGFAAARYDLAGLLNEYQRVDELLPHVERLLACDPGNIDYLNLKAQGLRFVGRTEEAIALMEQLLADHPDEEQSWVLCGGLLRSLGESDRATEMFRRALAVRAGSSSAYSSLANLKTFRFDKADLEAMEQQLALPAVRGTDRIRLEFALGKGLEDAGEYAASFDHYARGNRLQRATFFYDPQIMTADVQRSRAFFTQGFFGQRTGWGTERSDPIFIVGLPRSGSTLLEQILASHSLVEGTRELLELPTVASDLISAVDAPTESTFLERLGALGREGVESLAMRYLSRTQHRRQTDRPRFIDKLLGNWIYVGFIHLLFPRATIIDARRHPLGCGFSCYKQHFARGQKFTYDLAEFGRYYRDYAAFMEHVDATLPGRVHRVYYEQLVADPRREVQRLLDHCGLPFEEQCLRFYETRRVVTTISSEQVRRPIYAESVDQWRHYEPWLGPLHEVLGDLVTRYPAPQAPPA
jgi:tetratricopeptide (TPR) repeat protein